jgi:hypothetical protein
MPQQRFCSRSTAGKVITVGVCDTPPQAFSPGPPSGGFFCALGGCKTLSSFVRPAEPNLDHGAMRKGRRVRARAEAFGLNKMQGFLRLSLPWMISDLAPAIF